jgi:amidase
MKSPMSQPAKPTSAEFSRRALLQLGAATGVMAVGARASARPAPAAPTAADAGTSFPLEEATLDELQRRMHSGEETARSLTDKYLERIRVLDPTLHAVLETNPDAVAEAATLDTERGAGNTRGPLHGVPVLLKDNIATTGRMHATAGSVALLEATVAREAFLVGRLRAAGAVILGKTNLSEWANFRSSHSSSGWSGRGGQCHNPYVLDRSPSGSSSGSGAAVAANLCAVAVGTETDGSIVSPSAACGLVGLKPTVGLVSRSGIIPISHTQDTAGPMTRTVRDAAILLGVLAAPDDADPASRKPGRPAGVDFTRMLDARGLRGARIGVPRPVYFGYSPDTDALAEKALLVLKDAGAIVVDPAPIGTATSLDGPEDLVLLYEFKADLDAYLRALGGTGPRSLAELIAFNDKNAAVEMPFFGQDRFLKAQSKGPLTDPAYRKALALCRRLAGREGIDATMERHHLDALVAPTQGPAWLIDLVNGDSFGGSSSTPAAVAGYPSITVPMGQVHSLPVGLSFFGRAWSEPTLLRLAFAFEQATHHRQRPRLLPTAPLAGA